ncbi:hypothetical protein [Pseudomonas sp. PIC25]|uniref:hypothetical protein n=1 Tax=Pseudomonas sp. PIC25 TaxID=1958773 RepID=UPI00117A4E6A|nr:hypothetical protein [Pseudomonas sp. PIC25]
MEYLALAQFFTSARGVDVFWSPLAITVIGGLIVTLILKKDGSQNTSNRGGLSLSDIRTLIEAELAKHRYANQPVARQQTPRPKRRNGEDEGVVGGCFIALIFLSVFYARNQAAVLDYSVMAATSLFGFWFAGIVFSIISGTLSGRGWAIYATSVLVLTISALPMLYLGMTPLFAPTGIENLQQVSVTLGLAGFIKSYGAEGVAFLFSQVLGFLVLYGAWLVVLLSLVFLSASSFVATGVSGRKLWIWLSAKTAKFGNPIKATAIVLSLYAISFVMISGIAYEWWRSASSL